MNCLNEITAHALFSHPLGALQENRQRPASHIRCFPLGWATHASLYPVPVGSHGAVGGSKGCRMGRHSQSWCQGLPGGWWVDARWPELCKAVGRGRVFTPCWGEEEKKTSERICPADKGSVTERRGEEKRALNIGVCLIALSRLSKSLLCFAVVSPSLGQCTRLVLHAVASGLCFSPRCKGTCPLLRDRRGQ